jgi:hypothetical protein
MKLEICLETEKMIMEMEIVTFVSENEKAKFETDFGMGPRTTHKLRQT